MALKYKSLENGSIDVDDNGNPIVFDDEDDKFVPIGLNAIHLYSKIPELQNEAKRYREDRDKYKSRIEKFGELDPEEVHDKLKAIEGIDLAKAKEALATVANLDQLDRDRNIEIEKIKDQVGEAYKNKIREIDDSHTRKVGALEDAINKKDSAIRDLLIKGAFDSNAFIKEQTVIPSDMAYARFGGYFRVDEDEGRLKVVAVHPFNGINYQAGDPIYSLSRPGDIAQPEEAIEILINEYPNKDSILRTTVGGSAAGGNTSGTASKRAELERLKDMNPAQRLNELRKKGLT